eukprot:1801613-Rhodomonas_salina.1
MRSGDFRRSSASRTESPVVVSANSTLTTVPRRPQSSLRTSSVESASQKWVPIPYTRSPSLTRPCSSFRAHHSIAPTRARPSLSSSSSIPTPHSSPFFFPRPTTAPRLILQLGFGRVGSDVSPLSLLPSWASAGVSPSRLSLLNLSPDPHTQLPRPRLRRCLHVVHRTPE